MADFASWAFFADSPVDLGSRCTVFMNSSVKQAQKDGASIENISAGPFQERGEERPVQGHPVVDARSLGDHIVVQGGTFLNDAVLRAFEKEIGKNVIRPSARADGRSWRGPLPKGEGPGPQHHHRAGGAYLLHP